MFPGSLRILTMAILLIKWPIVEMKFLIQHRSTKRAGAPGSWSDRRQDRSWNPIWSKNCELARNFWSDHIINSDRIVSGIGTRCSTDENILLLDRPPFLRRSKLSCFLDFVISNMPIDMYECNRPKQVQSSLNGAYGTSIRIETVLHQW